MRKTEITWEIEIKEWERCFETFSKLLRLKLENYYFNKIEGTQS